MFIPNNSTVPKLQTAEDLQGDALLHYDAEMELMNLILLSISNDIYNSVDACTSAKDINSRNWLYVPSRAKNLEKSHDPLALVAHTGLSSRNTSSYYVTHPTSVVDYEDEYQTLQLIIATTEVEEEVTYARNCPKPRMLSRLEEIKELSCNISLMARIQPADNTYDAGPSYDSAFISELQSSSNTKNEEQMYPTHTKIISSTLGDDQIDSDIIFDSPNGNVNSGSIEKDTHVPKLCALEQLARNPYHLGNSEISLDVRDTEDTLDDASKSQQKVYEKMNDPIAVANKQNCWTIDYAQINALYKDFRDIKEMKDVIESTESELCELEKQNDFLKDQLLEVSLKHEVELSVLLNHECVDNLLHAEIEQLKKKSIKIQEGLQARIKILKKDVQECVKSKVSI
ncbi:hypothetical protein Tco_0226483 [Tanacetum coccineum]